MISQVSITILAENNAQNARLIGEHGLSMWIKTPEVGILFDTGQSNKALRHNAEALGIPLDAAGAIVLSHGHYDHTGGLVFALEQAPAARLFLHPSAMASHFSCRDGKSSDIGMSASVRDAVDGRREFITWTTGPGEIAHDIFVTGSIPRRNSFEDTGGPFYLDTEGKTSDPIADDQAMWIETSNGLVVLLGCAHAGVINTLDYIRNLTGKKPVSILVGGMHLASASKERLAWTMESLRKYNVARVYPCHCTGSEIIIKMKEVLGDRCFSCGVGTQIML